jgi:hypothetical protein
MSLALFALAGNVSRPPRPFPTPATARALRATGTATASRPHRAGGRR